MKWTPERIDRMRALAAEGQSASKIAAELGGFTRNAVIGKAYRLGVELKARPGYAAHEPLPVKKAPKAPKAAPPASLPPFLAPVILPVDPEFGAVDAILGLRNSTCRWPIGEPNDPGFRFCCAPADLAGGRPYCAAHANMAYGRGIIAERRAVKEARRAIA